MPSFRQILFPVDFSQQSRAMAPHVACMAAGYRARVTMLHVMEIPAASYPGWPVSAGLVDIPAMIEERKQRLNSFLRSEFETVSTARVMLEGEPGRMIADYAAKEKVDLIMMPTHGYGPFRRFLLGSVTAKTLHHAHCPVWTSAHMSETPAPSSGYHHVLCAVDLTKTSLPLLQWASEFARERGATLKLVHAIPAAKPPAGPDVEGGRYRAILFQMAGEEVAKLQQQAGTSLEIALEGDEVAAAVRKAAEETRADLVIIGRGVMQEAFGRLRTNVYAIVRDAPCPVISV
jgi:nucleotide-binding universal stress UspA family protein